jgi:hypothetical protein
MYSTPANENFWPDISSLRLTNLTRPTQTLQRRAPEATSKERADHSSSSAVIILEDEECDKLAKEPNPGAALCPNDSFNPANSTKVCKRSTCNRFVQTDDVVCHVCRRTKRLRRQVRKIDKQIRHETKRTTSTARPTPEDSGKSASRACNARRRSDRAPGLPVRQIYNWENEYTRSAKLEA